MRIDLAALSRSLREEPRQPPDPKHRRTPDPPELAAARARYHQTRLALEAARAGYQAAKQEHAASKQHLAVLRARGCLGSNVVEPPDSRG